MNKSTHIYSSRINKVIDYINNNLDKSISLNELASVSFFSPFHFHRIFVAVTGESVNQFTNRVRLEKSARLLNISRKTISYIAYECGFSSPSTFSRAFKQRFSCSPTSYRNNGNLINSKIRKEFDKIDNDYCKMSEDELRQNFHVEIKDMPKRRIAYIRVFDPYREGVLVNTFEQIVKWSKKMDLFHSETIFGMSMDDPMVTPMEKCRYEVCTTIPQNIDVNSNCNLQTTILPKCKYAVVSVSGSIKLVATAADYLFNNWIISSPYEPEDHPGLEIYLDKENIYNWTHFDLDLCIPIKNIKL